MKMGLRVSSSSRHRPSLRGRHRQEGRSWGPPSPARDPPEAVTAPGPAEEGVGQHHDEAPAAAQVHQEVGRRLCGNPGIGVGGADGALEGAGP